jgi:hypothetical protein
MNVNLVYVNYSNNKNGLSRLIVLMKLVGVYSRHVVVENNPNQATFGKSSISGTNRLQDFSGYAEGLAYLNGQPGSEYVLFANDTFSTNRYFGMISYLTLALALLTLRLRKTKTPVLIGEVSGVGFGEVLYGVAVSVTFSSFLFVMDKDSAARFYEKYIPMVDADLTMGDVVFSRSGMISKDYMEALNVYISGNGIPRFGTWYRCLVASTDVKLAKAKCLVLERMLPTYVLSHCSGEVSNLRSSRMLNAFRSVEERLVNFFKRCLR